MVGQGADALAAAEIERGAGGNAHPDVLRLHHRRIAMLVEGGDLAGSEWPVPHAHSGDSGGDKGVVMVADLERAVVGHASGGAGNGGEQFAIQIDAQCVVGLAHTGEVMPAAVERLGPGVGLVSGAIGVTADEAELVCRAPAQAPEGDDPGMAVFGDERAVPISGESGSDPGADGERAVADGVEGSIGLDVAVLVEAIELDRPGAWAAWAFDPRRLVHQGAVGSSRDHVGDGGAGAFRHRPIAQRRLSAERGGPDAQGAGLHGDHTAVGLAAVQGKSARTGLGEAIGA